MYIWAVIIIYAGELESVIPYSDYAMAKLYHGRFAKEHEGDSDYKVYLSEGSQVITEEM